MSKLCHKLPREFNVRAHAIVLYMFNCQLTLHRLRYLRYVEKIMCKSFYTIENEYNELVSLLSRS